MNSPFTPEQMERLDAWLRDNVPGLGQGKLRAESLVGGNSNVVVSISRDGNDGIRPLILRKAPDKAPPGSEKGIQREATVIRALTGTRVPHPQFHGFSDDPAILGGPFYLMDMVDGWAADLDPATDKVSFHPDFVPGPDRHYLGFAMIDGIVEMANLDYEAAGLGSFGRPDRFLERQAERWRGQLDSYPERYKGFESRDLPGLDYVCDFLKGNRPEAQPPGLMHGDYAMSNVMFANRPPARLAAIIDWETATIGDPLVDLAAVCGQLRRRQGHQPARAYVDPEQFPYFEDAVAYFAEKTGRDVSAIDYYLVLQKFRMACICEYKVAEAAVGIASPEKGARFDKIVRSLLSESETIARGAAA